MCNKESVVLFATSWYTIFFARSPLLHSRARHLKNLMKFVYEIKITWHNIISTGECITSLGMLGDFSVFTSRNQMKLDEFDGNAVQFHYSLPSPIIRKFDCLSGIGKMIVEAFFPSLANRLPNV